MPQGWLSDIAEAGAHADHLGDLAQWVPSQAALLGILAAAAIAGIVLWLAGRIVLKPAIVFLLALAGGGLGAIAAPMLAGNEPIPVAAGAGIGLALGALLGLIVFRFAMAVALGATLAVALPLAAAVPLGMPEEADEAWAAIAAPSLPPTAATPPDPSLSTSAPPTWAAIAEGNLADRAGVVTTAAHHALRALDSRWAQLSPGDRAIMALSSIAGAILGVALGLVLPLWAAGITSALLGPAVWLPCIVCGIRSAGLASPEALAHGPAEWLMIWGGLAAVGLAVQGAGLLGRRAAK